MESLYRKYRPQTFADVVGQQHVVGTLEHAVLEGRTSHAYLFCGPRGTGKTTMARLLAKALMCEQGAGHLPDGTCAQCELIAAGEHPDVYELDAASRTGVDSVREEIINSVSYAPTQGRHKVYIIDEVHMLTTAAFNALLKTLEEPPSHVVFVLCTTDPQKIPATILSRVQRFDFRPIGSNDILAHLAHVCEQEGFTYEEAALELVTAHARGGMRDALSTLEQLSVFGGGTIGLEAAQDLLGAVSGMALEQVVGAMAARDAASLFAQTGELVNAGRDLLQFTRELAAHMRDVYVTAVAGANPAVLPAGADVRQLQTEAAMFGSSDRLARILMLLGDVSRQMTTAPNQRLVLEIAFTRIARPESDITLESLAERIAELENKLAGFDGAVHVTSAAAVQVDVPAVAPATVVPPAAVATSANAAPQRTPAQESVPQPGVGRVASESSANRVADGVRSASRPAASQPVPASASQPVVSQPPQPARQAVPHPVAPQPAVQPAPQAVGDPGALQRSWRKVVAELTARIPPRGTLLANAVATSDNGTELVVSLPKGSSFALKMLERPDTRAVVDDLVRGIFGPRTLVYKEGVGSDQPLPPRRQGGGQGGGMATPPVRASRDSAPRQTSQPVAPAAHAPAFVSEPAPQPAHQPAKSDYPMPWDSPAQAVQSSAAVVPEEPYYEQVPYEDLGTFAESEDSMYAPAYPGQNFEPAPVQAPAPAPAPRPRSESGSQTKPQAKSQSESESGFQPKSQPEPKSPAPNIPADLSPELLSILQNAFEVFGENVHVSR